MAKHTAKGISSVDLLFIPPLDTLAPSNSIHIRPLRIGQLNMPCPQPDAVVPPPTRVATCVRCKANPAIAIFRDSIYCQECALAVFYQKAKNGLELARGAGLAKYVAAAQAAPFAEAESSKAAVASSSASSSSTNAEGEKIKKGKQINNGGGNAEVNVSANIAIAFSGGASSRALLRSATQYFRPETSFATRTARRAKAKGEKAEDAVPAPSSRGNPNSNNSNGRFNEIGKIFVFYIDDSAVIPNGEGVDRTEEARRMVEEENCPDLEFVPLKLEDVYRSTSSSADIASGVAWKLADVDTQHLRSASTTVSDPTQALKDLFSSLHPSNTPRTGNASARTRIEDLHRLLVSTLLRRTAAKYNCAALLLGDSATRISIRLIEDLAKGAGHKLPVQGSDAAWIDGLLVVRPFKGHLLQEILFYTRALGLHQIEPEQHVVPSTVSTKDILENGNANVPTMDKSSIARLTETFILNLEKGVASTVTTIGKTGGKLVLNSNNSDDSGDGVSGKTNMDIDDASHSTSGFQHVGPSVSLKSRNSGAGGGAGLSSKMSELAVSSPSKPVSEPRIGSRGIKLAQASAACFHWSIKLGCALCGMPSQHPHARHWKRDITISSLQETAPSQHLPPSTATTAATTTSSKEGEGESKSKWIELSDYLCYACLLVLAPPMNAQPETEHGKGLSLLPSYVLEHIKQASGKMDNVDAGQANSVALNGAEAPTEDVHSEEGKHGQCGSHNKPTPQPLNRAEIKAQINEFLLDDA